MIEFYYSIKIIVNESNVVNRISACQGDSGGPMAQYEKNDESSEAKLIGVVSWG